MGERLTWPYEWRDMPRRTRESPAACLSCHRNDSAALADTQALDDPAAWASFDIQPSLARHDNWDRRRKRC